MPNQLIYRSTVHGHADADLSQESRHVYFGTVHRIPRGEYFDRETRLAELQSLLRPRLVHGFMAEPVPGEPVERYEVYDLDSQDILVMHRVAMRPA
jgi:hypothetical protein